MLAFFQVIIYKPLVNVLALVIGVIPGGDVGVAIIILTILVKLVLYPLSQKSIEGQAKITELTPEINKIKAGGGSKEEQARLTFELYKTHKANPLSGCLLFLIQIPIVISLYYVFYKGLEFDSGVLYNFVKIPDQLNTMFLGLIDIHGKSILLGVLAGASQYFQAYYMPKPAEVTNPTGSFQESFNKSLQMQMKYVFPFLIGFAAYSISGAVALYFITSNIFAIGQQIYAKKRNTKLN